MSANDFDKMPNHLMNDEDYDDPNEDEALFLLALLLVIIVVMIVFIGLVVLIIHFLINGAPLVKVAALGFGALLGYRIYRYVNF